MTDLCGLSYDDWDYKYNRARWHRTLRSRRLATAREKGQHTNEEWMALVKEFGGRCVRCWRMVPKHIVKDHIVPICQGGSDGIDNLQPICARCNAQKGPETTNWVERRRAVG